MQQESKRGVRKPGTRCAEGEHPFAAVNNDTGQGAPHEPNQTTSICQRNSMPHHTMFNEETMKSRSGHMNSENGIRVIFCHIPAPSIRR